MKDPGRRGIRTLLWALLAAVPGIPATAAAFNLSAATTAKITAVAGLLTAVVTAVVNGAEDRGLIPAFFKAPASDGADPVPDNAEPDHPVRPPLLGTDVPPAVIVERGPHRP